VDGTAADKLTQKIYYFSRKHYATRNHAVVNSSRNCLEILLTKMWQMNVFLSVLTASIYECLISITFLCTCRKTVSCDKQNMIRKAIRYERS